MSYYCVLSAAVYYSVRMYVHVLPLCARVHIYCHCVQIVRTEWICMHILPLCGCVCTYYLCVDVCAVISIALSEIVFIHLHYRALPYLI